MREVELDDMKGKRGSGSENRKLEEMVVKREGRREILSGMNNGRMQRGEKRVEVREEVREDENVQE